MSKPHAVSLAYIDARPAAAAADLSQLPAGQAAEFINEIPVRYAIKIAASATAWSGALLLAKLTPQKAAGILREIPFAKATEILRLMPAAARDPVVQSAPRGLKKTFLASLSYPEDTVGACMLPDALSFQPEHLIKDVLAAIRKHPEIESELIFIVSDTHEFLGALDPLTLLRSDDNDRVKDVMNTDVPSCSARSRLSSIANIEAWARYSLLPVTNRSNHLIGALPRYILAEKLDLNPAREVAKRTSVSAALVSAFIYTAGEFTKLFADGNPRKKRQPIRKRQRKNRSML